MKTLIIIAVILILIVTIAFYIVMVVGSRLEKEFDKIKSKTLQNQTINNTNEYFHLKNDNSEYYGDHCVICGAIIPEGRQVCPKCEGGIRSKREDDLC